MLKGFRDFILRGNVVDLAIAVVIGAAFGAVVTSFTNDILMQIIAAIGGTPDFSQVSFNLGEGEIKIGSFINAVISFLIIAGVIYFAVVTPMNKVMDRFKTEEPVSKPTRDCPECESSIPVSAKRCAFCTAEVGPAPAI
jgi:large conductance mechanosensitive channel